MTPQIVVFIVVLFPVAVYAGLPIDLIVAPMPQSYTDTCQAYGIVLALASTPGSGVSVATSQQLAEAEKTFRKWRDAVASETIKNAKQRKTYTKQLEKDAPYTYD